MKKLLSAGAIGLMLAALSASHARAGGFTVILTEQGSNVVANGSGAIDLTGLSLFAADLSTSCSFFGALAPSHGTVLVGGGNCPSNGTPAFIDWYVAPPSGPVGFGTGRGFEYATPFSGTGDVFGFYYHPCFPSCNYIPERIIVPQGYVSGDPLSDSSTWDNANYATLGVKPGTYVWTWGDGANQSFTLDVEGTVPSEVPEPGYLALFAAGLLGIALVRPRRRKSAEST
ncbi:MAG TPA: PEP-CTERM sorting domain-containing protein [Steroidobacteraceae bacterium]